jgi:hypothetical protein
VQDLDLWHIRRARQQVILQSGRERLATRIEGRNFVKAGPDALRRSATNLPVDNHRIDQRAAVFDNDVIQNLDRPG